MVDIHGWVEKAGLISEQKFRQAVHTILHAIATTPNLKTEMIMKGGILLALQYSSSRFTRDIDFSTPALVRDFNMRAFLSELEQALAMAVEDLEYGLDCRIQSHEMRPPSPDATMPTLKLRIGYADKADHNSHKRLLNKQHPNVVEVDYSFNEPISEQTRVLELNDGGYLTVYSFNEVIAEKYRALLQQETRHRVRRQDAYDIFCLLQKPGPITDDVKAQILASLKLKAQARNMNIDIGSMGHEEVIRRSRAEYPKLQQELEEPLPPFDDVYAVVKGFYESLGW
ncbi:MAG: nucleotidyl transferase AbiEii/AbiGii toxin family protein [Acidiferrobacterales bacterium]